MSRWTKGELTIGEIAQMEHKLADSLRALQEYRSALTDKDTLAIRHLAVAVTAMGSILSRMLKG